MYSVTTIINAPDVCKEYGLTNVHAAMKRPFHEAFPNQAKQPARAPVEPQLSSQPIAWIPRWAGLVMGSQQAPKRQRTEGAHVSQAFDASTIGAHTYPTLRPVLPGYVQLPSREKPSTTHVPFGASENYSVEGMMDADLVRGAELLALDPATGPKFLREVFKKRTTLYSADEDRLDAAKKVISILSSIEECIRSTGDRFPNTLQSKLVFGLMHFLSRSVKFLKYNSQQRELQKSSYELLSRSHFVWKLSKDNIDSQDLEQVRFVGGKNKFEFLRWCSENNIRLDAKQIDTSFEKLGRGQYTDFAQFFDKHIVDKQQAGANRETDLDQ